jgi:hypothetical protein
VLQATCFPFVQTYLMLLPINPMNRIPILLVNHLSNRRVVFGRTGFLHITHLYQQFVPLSHVHIRADSHNAPHTS